MSETYYGPEDGYTNPKKRVLKERVLKEPSPRKSLAIDVETYEKLRDICADKKRSLIAELQDRIEIEHERIFGRGYRWKTSSVKVAQYPRHTAQLWKPARS